MHTCYDRRNGIRIVPEIPLQSRPLAGKEKYFSSVGGERKNNGHEIHALATKMKLQNNSFHWKYSLSVTKSC